jgi:hypothetical protein
MVSSVCFGESTMKFTCHISFKFVTSFEKMLITVMIPFVTFCQMIL